MISGIAFSIVNFTSVETKAASGILGAWVYSDGTFRCMGDGNDCAIDPGWGPR
jgi:hypothetical protein